MSKKRHHHRQKFHSIALFVGPVGVVLNGADYYCDTQEETQIMTTVTVGHKLELSIVYLDQNGNPMLTTPLPDAPALWGNTTPAVETLVAAADGNTAEATAVTAGSDVVNMSVTVGGKTFAATLSVTVEAAPQVLTSVEIGSVVN